MINNNSKNILRKMIFLVDLMYWKFKKWQGFKNKDCLSNKREKEKNSKKINLLVIHLSK
jgi:hypothetical protein